MSTSTQMPSTRGIRISPRSPCTTSRLPARVPFDAGHWTNGFAPRRFDRTADQVVVIKRACGKPLQRLDADAQFRPCQRLRRVHRGHSSQTDDRPAPMEPDTLNRQRRRRIAPSHMNNRARPESLIREIGRRIDDDLSPISMGTRHPAHDRHVFPGRRHGNAIDPESLGVADFEGHLLASAFARNRCKRAHGLNRAALASDQLAHDPAAQPSPR